MYVYRESKYDHGLYTVGFYDPDGQWEPESDWESSHDAAQRVHYLNGGTSNEPAAQPDEE